jgi:uncharacterized SAM-binding protein YcdF (DUF218 family)
MNRRHKATVIIACAVGVWFISFLFFVTDVRFCSNIPNSICDNVVVLTGDKNRIPYALQYIYIHKPKNIFISGVYEKVKLEDILGSHEMPNYGGNFILGRHAKNTVENAFEIMDWTMKNNIKEILLITSDYHMRRSVLEIKNVYQELLVIPYASKSEFDIGFMVNCFKEFHKIIYASIRNFCSIKK